MASSDFIDLVTSSSFRSSSSLRWNYVGLLGLSTDLHCIVMLQDGITKQLAGRFFGLPTNFSG